VRVEDRDIFNEIAVGRGNNGASDIVLKAKITNTSSITGIGFLSLAIKFTIN
jgi:hypothetical protein